MLNQMIWSLIIEYMLYICNEKNEYNPFCFRFEVSAVLVVFRFVSME